MCFFLYIQLVFFFKQKTAYEMRISDWSSDVCSSDLVVLGQVRPSTSQTVYRADWIGTAVDAEERPLVTRAFQLGEIIEGETTIEIGRASRRDRVCQNV